MLNKQNKQLYVVREGNKSDKPAVKKTMKGNDIKNILGNIGLWVKSNWQNNRKIIFGMVVALIIVVAAFLLVHLQTYTEVRINETYKISGASDNNYEEFADGLLKYSRDGISYLDQEGEEQWNLPYQIKTPFVDANSVSAAVADKGGNDILVFQEDGLKGEIKTTLPIEKISVSEQGIVCAILKNESTPQIICYDTAGNILVEHKVSLSGTGYPMDVALSADGGVLQVVYLYVQQGQMISKVAYYNFGKAGEETTDHQVAYKEYKDSLMVSGFFVNKNISIAVGDNCFTIFKGKEVPKEVTTITLDKEVKSIFHNEKYIGLVLKNEGSAGYELRLYNATGKVVTSEEFSGDYKNVKISDDQVIMYDGKKCCIFMKNGILKFDGEMSNNILEMIPVSGVNKYIVVNANGMEKVRLVK